MKNKKDITEDLDSLREYRRERFGVALSPDSHWKTSDGDRMMVLSITTNGHQFQSIGLYKDELEQVAKVINDYLTLERTRYGQS